MKIIVICNPSIVTEKLIYTLSSPSDFDSINAQGQEGSCIIAFAKSISWALVLSISSVSRVINLQPWVWYHVTMWDYIDVMWSQRIDIAAEVQDLLKFLTGLERLRNRLPRGQSISPCPLLSFSSSQRSPHLSWDSRPRQEASWRCLTGTAAETPRAQSDVVSKTPGAQGGWFPRDAATYLSYHCTYSNPL